MMMLDGGMQTPQMNSRGSPILLIGAAGGPNFGDEAIMGNWVRAIHKSAPERRIICDGYNLPNLRDFLAGGADTQSEPLSLWSHIREMAGTSFADANFSDLLATAGQPRTPERLLALSEGFRNEGIEHIHFIGGGYFNSQWPTHYLLTLLANTIASMNNIGVTGSGQGLLPVSADDADRIAAEFRNWRFIDVRDQESFSFLENHDLKNVVYSGDDALLHFTDIVDDWLITREAEPAAVICIQNDLFPGDEAISRLLGDEVIRKLHHHGIQQIILLEAMHGDVIELPAETVQICNEMRIRIRPISCNMLLAKGLPVHPDSIFITSRYHPHFFGVACGCRGISLAANPYYENKHRALEAIGSTWPISKIHHNIDFTKLVGNVLGKNFILPKSEFLLPWASRKKEIVTEVIACSSRGPVPEENYIGRALRAAHATAESLRSETRDRDRQISRLLERQSMQFGALKAVNEAYRQLTDQADRDVRHLNNALIQQASQVAQKVRDVQREMTRRVDEIQEVLEDERSTLHTEKMRRYGAEYEVLRYQNSLSWKVTRPLRTLAAKLRRLRASILPTRQQNKLKLAEPHPMITLTPNQNSSPKAADVDPRERMINELRSRLEALENRLRDTKQLLQFANDKLTDYTSREVARATPMLPEAAQSEATYQEWTRSVFGRALMPVTDRSIKAIVSFDPESYYYKNFVRSLFAAELQLVRDLLFDIQDRSVPGEFAEFGIYRGDWVNRLYDESRSIGLEREIWGFDSFQGLSDPDPENDDPFWKAGMFSASVELVRSLVKADQRPDIKLVEGFFADSLSKKEAQSLGLISYARIDCDIYQPTVECLDYLTDRLSHGSVLVFDDWSFDTRLGETRAFAEWTSRASHLEFEFLFFGVWDHFYVRVWHKGQPRWQHTPGAGQNGSVPGANP